MSVAFIFSFVSWLFLAFALLGLSTDPSWVEVGNWAKGTMVDDESGELVMDVYAGVQMRVDKVDCNLDHNVSFCILTVEGLPGFERSSSEGEYIRLMRWNDAASCRLSNETDEADRHLCEECAKNSLASVSLAIFGFLGQIPQLHQNLQRMTRFGDLNCLSFQGVVGSLLGNLIMVAALAAFSASCVEALPTTVPNTPYLRIEWSNGVGFNAIALAAVLKLVDVVLHLLTPTPAARWKPPPAGVTEIRDFLLLATRDPEDVELPGSRMGSRMGIAETATG